MVDLANSEFYSANVTPITTDFNVTPYYDDFDGKNNYFKLLFKPGFAVQARELTQIQSILQDQIQKFGQHVFKEGSAVIGGKFDINKRASFVKVNDFDTLGEEVSISRFEGQIVTGQVTGIRAYVNLVLDGVETSQNTKTLYVSYLSGNENTNEVVFTPNEPLVSNVGTLVVGNSFPVGFASVFTINEGIRFAKEHFIYHTKQSVVVDRYGSNPTCRVGFFLEESIVNASQDSSLLDPALESSNFSAPGADRFKITPILTRLEINDTSGFPDYVNLFSIIDGQVVELNERPFYNVLRDEMAKRTNDESGDYYVRGFNPVIEEHLDNGSNFGYLTLDRGGDSQLLSVQIEPGTAYVKGYEVNKLVTNFLTTPKATDFSNVNGQIISSTVGSYIVANNVVGAWNVNLGQTVDLYNTAQTRVARGVSSTSPQTGSKIGTARVKSISKDSGTLGTPDGAIRIHLFDVNMLGSNSFANVRSVYYDNLTTSDVGADVVLTSNQAKLSDPYQTLLYYTGSDHTKMIRSPDGTIDTSFYFKKTSDITIASPGTFSLTSTVANEIFPYGTTTLGDSDKVDIFLNLNANANISIPGTALSGASSNSLRGSGTSFTRLNVGDKIEISGNSRTYVISAIANDNTVTVTSTLPPTLSGNSFFKAYKSGDMIDLSAKGVDGGVTRTVSATSSTLTFDLKETFGTTVSGTITYTMARSNAREVRKVLKTNRYVLINCATNAGANTGPYNLGFSDVYRIKSIRKATSFTTVNDGVDVTSDFVLDNGQRDSYYGNARISPYYTLTPSDRLLVCLDYFEPDYTLGVGYFSVDSYPVNDIGTQENEITTEQLPVFRSPDTGLSYDLRNYFDFRPVFTNTATDATVLATATTNPAVSSTLQYEVSGLRLPADSEPIIYDYSYYLARRDVVALNQDGEFIIIRGVPASVPITPSCPNNLMSVARLSISPYPSLSPAYADNLGRASLASTSSRTSHVRFTMRDIGVLKQRIDNLESYVSLSLLEKSAVDLKFLDENGLDRFKNGIFVDSFTSFMMSDYGNPDHHISYDPKEGSIRPLFEVQAIGYDYYSGTNVTRIGDLIMLPYTEVSALSQPFATTFRNVETTVYKFVGRLYLDPETDYWVNTDRLASQTFHFGATDADVTPYSIAYGSWQTTVTGVTTADPILLSSSSTSTSTTALNPGATSSSGITYTLSFAGPVHYGGMGAIGAVGGPSTIGALISMYGASTPITFTGKSQGGAQSLGTFAGGPLASRYAHIKTLGDVNANQSLLKELNHFEIRIVSTTATQTTTTTTTNAYSTTTTTGTQASRAFTETFQNLHVETQSIGDRVTSVAPIADIRPQTIAFEARGVKASTRHYVFFDGQLMSSYITPATGNYTVMGANTSASLITASAVEGGPLYSDSDGVVYGFLRIPSDSVKSFRTGSKEVIVTDSLTNEPDATSYAKAYFVAQGINQTLQETIISTGEVITTQQNGVQRNPVVYSNTVNMYNTTGVAVSTATVGATTATAWDVVSCMAYSFKLNTPFGEEGTFLSSVDVFFAGKDPSLGIWFEIRAMDNGGNITKIQVPNSEVWLESNQVNTSEDGSVATNVKFKAPIFLLNNQEYAFVIHTVGINPNYYMYVSVLGQEDILTKLPVNSRPLTGTLFTTNNNTDWDIVPRTDLKCTFYRASFNTNVTGQAILGNQQREYIKLPLNLATGSNTSWFGERFRGNDKLNLSSPSGTIVVGDRLIGSNSGANSVVLTISGSEYAMNNTGYSIGESISVRRANGLLTTITSSVVSTNTAAGTIYKVVPKNDSFQFNGNSAVMIVENTNGLFGANDVLRMEFSGNTVNAIARTKQVYSSIQFEPSFLDFIPTSLDFAMLTVSNTGSVGAYNPIVNSVVTDFDTEQAIYSRTDEILSLGSAPSNRVRVTMSSASDYLSPVIDTRRSYTVYVNNLINSNTANELLPAGGSLKNKYISQVVTLADGQDAEDLRVILSAYRPPGSNADVKVYVRVTNGEDFESIYTRNWIEMEPFDDLSYSSLTNRKDWREFNYRLPDSVMLGRNDQDSPIIQYTNGANTTFEGFKQYQIKIGLQSDTSAIYPRVADLRVIALQK
jgi:hypothetical protein